MTKAKKTSARRAAPAKRARSAFAENARIKVLVDQNPTRKGTGRFERVARILKHNGKTVADFVKHGGKIASLSFAVEHDWIKVVAR